MLVIYKLDNSTETGEIKPEWEGLKGKLEGKRAGDRSSGRVLLDFSSHPIEKGAIAGTYTE